MLQVRIARCSVDRALRLQSATGVGRSLRLQFAMPRISAASRGRLVHAHQHEWQKGARSVRLCGSGKRITSAPGARDCRSSSWTLVGDGGFGTQRSART